MPTNVEDIIRKLSPALRKRVKTRAAELIAEEMTLRELRHARKFRAWKSEVTSYFPPSARPLRPWGTLSLVAAFLVAAFPDREPVVLAGIADHDPGPKRASRRQMPA